MKTSSKLLEQSRLYVDSLSPNRIFCVGVDSTQIKGKPGNVGKTFSAKTIGNDKVIIANHKPTDFFLRQVNFRHRNRFVGKNQRNLNNFGSLV